MTTEKKNNQISRKDFIKGVGKSIAGVTILGGVAGVLTACTEDEVTSQTPAATGGETTAPQWPFTYVKIDSDKAAMRAYEAYNTGAG